jgi:hypothetical protein
MRTNAGVFVKDGENKVQINEINVLEIVAEEGQQVLGYTVEGEEPISKANIESYRGTADIDIEDFKNATGYILDKTQNGDGTFSYKVVSSVLNNTFNENVLADSMAAGEIHINVVQAKDVTLKDINNTNLIFINTNDYNDNLMYYYDTFVNNGRLGYTQGYKGKDYTYKEISTDLKSNIAIKKICSAAGNNTLAYNLTVEDFTTAGVTGCSESYLTMYQRAVALSEKEAFDADTLAESFDLISGKLAAAFEEEQQEAFDYIKENVIGQQNELTDEQKENVKYYLSVGGWSDYVEDNIDYYIEQFKAANATNVIFAYNIQELITNGNGTALIDVLPKLYEIKQDALAKEQEYANSNAQDVEEFVYEISDEDRASFVNYMHMLNISDLLDEYMNDYIETFCSSSFEMSNPEESSNINVAYSEIKDMVKAVNDNNRDTALQLIADSVSSDEIYSQLVENAANVFKFSNLIYTEDNINLYLEAINGITDENYFKDQEDGRYLIEKIQSFITDIDEANKGDDGEDSEEVIISYDLSWTAAMGIYEYALDNNGGLMYNTQLLTNKTIGDYTDVDKQDNTNNLYKLLLISRQLKSTYYEENYANRVDGYGVYYPDGLDSVTGIGIGEGIDSWNIETFGTDYANKTKYHEPSVVGATYLDDGSAGSSVNYVYKHIYSFTGSQFFGGEKFVLTNLDGEVSSTGVLTPDAKYSYSETVDININDSNVAYKYLYLCTGDYKWSTAYVYMWGGDSSESKDYQMECVDYTNWTYRVKLPADADYTKVLFYKSSISDNANTTVDILLPSNWNGTEYYLSYNSNDTVDKDNGKIRTYVLTKYDSVYGLSNTKIYLNSLSYNWTGNVYAYFWGTGYNAQFVKMTKDTTTGLYYVSVPKNAQYVLFRNSNDWNSGTSSQNILLPTSSGNQTYSTSNGHIYYLEYLDTGNNKINLSTSRYSDKYYNDSIFNLTNSIENGTVEFGGALDLQFTGTNISNVRYMINNSGFVSVNLGDTITIGSGTNYDVENIRLDVRYKDYSNNEIVKTYYYKKLSTGSLVLNNFIENGTVEYRGNMDVTVNYENVTDVQYCLNGGSYTSVNSGDVVNVGSDALEDSEIVMTFKFKSSGVEKTVSTYLHKNVAVQASTYANYLSTNTASSVDASSLASQAGISNGANKGEVVRYIMGVSLLEIEYPLNILDIEPAADASTLDNVDKARELADMLGLSDIKDKLSSSSTNQYYYKKYFNVTSMSVREFNTKYVDLTADYDLIYIGVDSGHVKLKDCGNNVKRTDYNDNAMDGFVYTGIGDKYTVWAFLRGTAAEDFKQVSSITNSTQLAEHKYWVEDCFDGFTNNSDSSWNLDSSKLYVVKDTATTTRLSPYDLTVKSMNTLLDYVKSGYPILLADEVMYCDDTSKYIENDGNNANASKWRYVDPNSKMWAFVQELKQLGKDSTGRYTGINDDGSKVFSDGKAYPSVVAWSNAKTGKNPENLSDSNKLSGGLQYALKRISRVEFELTSKPTEYGDSVNSDLVGTTISKTSEEYTKYSFTLKVKGNYTQDWLENNYSYQLYVDKSGVGKFEESQLITLDPSAEYILNDKGLVDSVVVYGDWPEGLEGFIPWKIEAYSDANRNVKFSYTGYSAFEKISADKRDVYVLWIRTEHTSATDESSAKNGYTVNFTNFVRENENYIEDYKVHILSMKYTEFKDMYKTNWTGGNVYTKDTTLLKVNKVSTYMKNRFTSFDGYGLNTSNSMLTLDRQFDMIVFGFSDSYVGEDLDNSNLLNDLTRYIDEGRSLFFTHDGSSYLSSMNYYKDNKGNHIKSGESDWYWARYTTSYLRERLGMDVYGITNSSSNLTESQQNARKYLSDDIKQSDLRGFTEGTIFHYEGNISEGTQPTNGNMLYTASAHSTGAATSIKSWVYTTTVRKVNKGQITEYPFVTGRSNSKITTNTTHAQYMQLDMENSDTTVWYTLDGTSGLYLYTSGDGANNYYIYSSGNITYTGAGHEKGGLKTEEKKLFVNTVISALKLGNLEPVVQYPYSYTKTLAVGEVTYMDYYPDDPDSDGLVLTFRGIDYDKASGATNTFNSCKIYIDKNRNGVYDSRDILLNDTSVTNANNNQSHYISDTTTLEPTIVYAADIKNRENVSILITKDDVNEIGKELSGNYTDESVYSQAIYDYPIIVELTDDSEGVASKEIYINYKEYVAPDLFKLN